MKILFLTPYPLNESPSQRFRFEQYINLLTDRGYKVHFQSFLNSHNWQLFYKPGRALTKTFVLFKGFVKRFFILFTVPRVDFVFIHREATPIGPPIFEWTISKVFRKKIIYDFDDAIWSTDRVNESTLLKILKWRSKVGAICRWSYKVSCGNDYLADYARRFNARVVINPTTIDTEKLHNRDSFVTSKLSHSNPDSLTIGWTGSHSTLKYLHEIEPVIRQLEITYPRLKFLVIANQPPQLFSASFVFVQWSKETEVADLLKIDIGIMPLPDNEWSKGKCGFKALQYMALEIPTVASPVGVNTKIIDHGINGFLCQSPSEWIEALRRLIEDEELRKKIGKQGKEKIRDSYSVLSNTSTFLSLFG